MTTTPMSKERKGEIALVVLKDLLLREGVKISKNFSREIIDRAKKLGVDEKDAMQFTEEMVRGLVDQIFQPRNERQS